LAGSLPPPPSPPQQAIDTIITTRFFFLQLPFLHYHHYHYYHYYHHHHSPDYPNGCPIEGFLTLGLAPFLIELSPPTLGASTDTDGAGRHGFWAVITAASRRGGGGGNGWRKGGRGVY